MEGLVMMSIKNNKKLIGSFFCLLVTVLVFNKCFGTPQLNQQDPFVIYSVKCSDKFYEKRDKFKVNFGFAPFYQQTHYARNGYGKKVPLDAMNGQLNMLAPFFDIEKMTPKTFNSTNYPNLFKAKQGLFMPPGKKAIDYSNPVNYDPNPTAVTTMATKSMVTLNSVRCNYEKMGLRGQVILDFGCGIGAKVKTGIVEYDYKGTNSTSKPESPDPAEPTNGLYNALLTSDASSGIFEDLDLDMRESCKTIFEDTHAELYFQTPFDFTDEGETVVTFAPYFSVGVWLPSGQEKDYKKFHSLPTGNNGHFGVTFEGAFNFEFPGTVQLSVGGGALVCDSRKYSDFRFPTNPYQSGFYPWTTKIDEKPGTTWYFNTSFKAENFIPNLSFYFDYVYTYHGKDEITVEEPSTGVNQWTRKVAFNSEKSDYIDRSIWKDQKFNAGLSYRIARQLALGFAIQAHISGRRVFKTTTEMGYIDLTF
jgi:hypothetical protein